MPKFYHRAPERSFIYGKMPGFSNPVRTRLDARPSRIAKSGGASPTRTGACGSQLADEPENSADT